MEDFDIIYELMQRKNISNKQMSDCLTASTGTRISEQRISDWKSKRIKSWTKYIIEIAYCLGVTVGDCLGIPTEFDAQKKPPDPLRGLKDELYNIMDTLTPDDQQRLLEHAELLLATRQKKST